MNEQERREAQKRLEDEERRRQMGQGGETQRAELAMEEREKASRTGGGPSDVDYQTAQEEQQKKMMSGEGQPYRGYGETQQAEQAMWGRSTTKGAEEMVSQKRMSEEEMRKTGSDQVGYPAGSGSYYSETFEKPTGTAGPESSFGRVEGEPRASAAREGQAAGAATPERLMSQEEMRRTGSDQTVYPAGSGTYYSETFEKPSGTAGPESSFGRTEYMPSGRASAVPEVPPSEAATKAGGIGEKMGAAVAPVVSKSKEYGAKVSESVKGATKGQSSEDVAHRAGEVIGTAIRKTAIVAKELGEGFRKGLNPEKHETEAEMEPRPVETGVAGREVVQKESYVRESPTTEERKYQETKKKEKV